MSVACLHSFPQIQEKKAVLQINYVTFLHRGDLNSVKSLRKMLMFCFDWKFNMHT